MSRSWLVGLCMFVACGVDPGGGQVDALDTGASSGTSGPGGGESTGAEESSGQPFETSTTGMDYACDEYGEAGDEGAEDDTFGLGDDMPLGATIYDVQAGTVSPGDWIRLVDVVVTTPVSALGSDPGMETFVQERQGGAYSGIRVRLDDGDDPSQWVPGEAVDLVGQVQLQRGFFSLVLEHPPRVTLRGATTLPSPTLVDPRTLTEDDARAYEGITIRVENAEVTDPDPCEGEFVIDDTLRVDDRFVPTAFPTTVRGQMFRSVEGVLVDGFDQYELAPPSAASIDGA